MDMSAFNHSRDANLAAKASGPDGPFLETALSLYNLETTIDHYLNDRLLILDVETRSVLAKTRDALGAIAQRTKTMSCDRI